MTDLAALEHVADAGGAWRDDVSVARGVADPDRLALLAELLGGEAPRSTVPPMWVGVVTASWPPYDGLGADGHPRTGVGYPPLPDRRRLFAGGRLTVHAPLLVGAEVTRRTAVTAVRAAQTRTGPLLFVTLTHTYTDGAGAPVAVEEHDLAYRSGPAATTVDQAAGAERSASEVTLTPDAVALFRFSALTGNSHRIHYDEGYASEVEGLPGRLVHGPLLALLLLELPRRLAPGRAVASYSFRLTRPVTLGSVVGARRDETSAVHWSVTAGADGVPCATGKIGFVEESG